MTSISVAVATFNGVRFLGKQLDSIIGQTLSPLEIVVSDDGSDDGTRALVEERSLRSPIPIRLLPSVGHVGVSGNFEQALAATSGELIALSDQDDTWHPEHLRRLADRFDEDPRLLLVHSDARLVDAGGVPSGVTLFEALRVRPEEIARIQARGAFDVLLRRNLVTGATTMIRRELFELASPFGDGWIHDEWLAIVAAADGAVGTIGETLVDYRQHGGNEIGARRLGFADLLGRLVEPAGARHAALAAKWTELARRAPELGFDERQRAILEGKAEFERSRAADPALRLRRIPRVAQRALRGSYPRFASQGRTDILRDLLSARSTGSAMRSAS